MDTGVMKISFARTGDVDNLPLVATIDSSSLSPEDSDQLRQLLAASDFFHLPPVIEGRKLLANTEQYELSVETDGDLYPVRVIGEPDDRLQPLIEWLITKAQSVVKINFERMRDNGARLSAMVSTDDLSTQDALALRSMIEQSDFFNMPSSAPVQGSLRYRIRVEGYGQDHILEINNDSLPATLRPLIDYLTSVAEKTIWVDFKRTGGITGSSLATIIDSRRLTPDDTSRLRQLIDDADFFNLPGRIEASNPEENSIQYDITIEAGEMINSVVVRDEAGPTELHRLIDWLMDRFSESASRASCAAA
ncbi:MAG TPA: protealysin inhibitor emfourin [Methanotrichaceae archaeon]|nr:protealysin inhibitor emfourin [Methanotrichaceae archaeon]